MAGDFGKDSSDNGGEIEEAWVKKKGMLAVYLLNLIKTANGTYCSVVKVVEFRVCKKDCDLGVETDDPCKSKDVVKEAEENRKLGDGDEGSK